jgi:CMP-N-acetylneuraminic acid synthetase
MIILFTDMFQNTADKEKLFNALQHLKHNKHKVVIFHVYDKKTEINFDFDNAPRKFIDLETGEQINIFADNIKEAYEEQVNLYFKDIAMTCAQNKIKYVPVAVEENFEKILTTYLVEKQMFG